MDTKKCCNKCGVTLVVGTNWMACRQRQCNYICTPCGREYDRKYREANREAVRGYKRKWAAANPEAARKWAAANPEAVREYNRKWAATSPEVVRARDARRRALKAAAIPPWETPQALADFERTRWVFAALHGVDESEVHADHIVPLRAAIVIDGKRVRVASGLHCVDNLTWKLGTENCSKGNLLDEREIDRAPVYEQVSYRTLRGRKAA